MDDGEHHTRVLVRLLAEQTARTFQAVDLTLAGVVDALALMPEVGEHDPAVENMLRERLKALPPARALLVVGPDGFITQHTTPNISPTNVADREYFVAHAADASPAMRIGEPLLGRIGGTWMVALSRRITRADGSFGGVVVAAIDPKYFEAFYRELDLKEFESISMFRLDGILIARTPHHDETAGKDFSERDLFTRDLPIKSEGSRLGRSVYDEKLLIFSYRTIVGYPIVVTVAVIEEVLVASWRRHAVVTTLTAGLAALLILLLQTLWVRRQVEQTDVEQERERLAQELEKERLLLKGTLAHLPSGVLAAAAPEGRLVLHNAMAEHLIGHPIYDARTMDDYVAYGAVHPDGSPYRAEEYPLARALREETVRNEEMLYRRGDGSLTTLLVSAAPIRDPGERTRMAVATFHDISERQRMEQELRIAQREAVQANLAKSKFLAAASHDLRQPLQSLFLFVSALRPQVQTDHGAKALDTLEHNLTVLKGLLDSLLDVSRLEAGVMQPTLENFLVGPMLDNIGASFTPIAHAKGLNFEVDRTCDVSVHSDQLLLGRMVRNLVENAIKYTERGSIRLACCVVGDRVRLEVHDTGIGIAPDQLEAIFMEFHQIDNPQRDQAKGLGLGLSIVQRLSKLLDHPVSVQSTPGRGSVFTVDVPFGKEDKAHPPGAVTAVAPDGDRRRS
jgi:PAS domain S-box-containing protein